MSNKEKLIERFLSKPNDFSYDELKRLLSFYGYIEKQTSGSRVVFFNKTINHSIKLHKPHSKTILKKYQIKLIMIELMNKKHI
jgi:hypothetical protein